MSNAHLFSQTFAALAAVAGGLAIFSILLRAHGASLYRTHGARIFSIYFDAYPEGSRRKYRKV